MNNQIPANNPARKSWIHVPADSDFPIQNLPLGCARKVNGDYFAASIIGNTVINLETLAALGFLNDLDIDKKAYNQQNLNFLLGHGKQKLRHLRNKLSDLFSLENQSLQEHPSLDRILLQLNEVELCMPITIGDYTDFYSSIDHATNVGKMFRDPSNALLPNWKHMPVGYHGRASSIVVSGAQIHRPKGQTKADDAAMPSFGPSKQLDFELETAFVICAETQLGQSIDVNNAEEFIWGMVLFNGLSARDIQKWEYVPLGPFLGKNFGSVISPWIVSLDALQPFRTNGYTQEPEVLPYLKYEGNGNYDIHLEVSIQPENAPETTVSKSNFKYMYWNMFQQLAHQTINGCNIRIGDLYASGTISGPQPHEFGSMLELSWKGTQPIPMQDGSTRVFLKDLDTCIIRGYAQNQNIRIGFGTCECKILPAN